jgi:conjugal transfer pilin signal peptidase TrbI
MGLKRWGILLVILLFVACLISLPHLDLRILYSKTKSLRYSWFLETPNRSQLLEKGDYISLYHELSPIILAKQVYGIPGDRIAVEDGVLLINDYPVCHILQRSKSGIEYTPLAVQAIPNGHYLVLGHHEESYDSRYQEFGLISEDQVEGRLWPLF